jgi:UDP-GlcNAc:undecaprenyl-phosphate GlcNAc-1-phosphate transferase
MFLLGDATAPITRSVVGDNIGVFFVAFVLTIMFVPVVRWLAVRKGIVDLPDVERKDHLEPIAYLGGVALLMGWLAGVVYGFYKAPQWGHFNFPVALIFGATVITVTGLFDDVRGISPRVKVGGQFIAAAALAWSSQNMGTELVTDVMAAVGVKVPFFVAYHLGAAVIAAFVLGGCNSMNLMDGLDGLAAGVAGIVCIGLLFIALNGGLLEADPALGRLQIVMCLAIVGAVLGFLPYNFNPANIFMGDAGSMLLGYLCCTVILLFAAAPYRGPGLVTAAVIVCALPIVDMILAVSRRILQGSPVSQADHEHLHHRVLSVVMRLNLSKPISVKISVVLMYLMTTAFAVLGCSLVFLRWRYVLAVFVALFGFIVVGAYKAGRYRALFGDQHTSEREGT